MAKSIGGQASIDFDADGLVTSVTPATVTVDVKKPGKKLILTLPFPLTDTTVITFTGGLTRTINVADDLKGSIGRFRLDVNFDGSLLPDGVATLPRTLDLALSIGTQAYPGTASLGPDELHVHENEWETEEED